MTLLPCIPAPCPPLHFRRCVCPGIYDILRSLRVEPAACPLCGRLPFVSLADFGLSCLLLVCSAFLNLLDRCSARRVSRCGGPGLGAAVCAPAPFLGWDFRRDCAIFGSMGETNVATVISSTGITVSGACWHRARHQWYEVCGGGSGVEAIPLPPCLHRGFVCRFALCGLWVGGASIPVCKRVICPVPGLHLWCHGRSGGW